MLTKEERARLAWHCRRGMLELDIILTRFFDAKIDTLDKHQIQQFDALLSNTDPELYSWLMGFAEPPTNELLEIVTTIRNHH